MALPVSYGSAAGFQAYHAARGNTAAIAFDDDEVNAALLVASEWIDGSFRPQFPGLKIGQRDQIREWPRQGAVDIYGFVIDPTVEPVEVDNATYEAALKQLDQPGALLVDWTPQKYKSASVDGAVNVAYMTFTQSADVQTRFALIGQIITPVLINEGGLGGFSGLSGSTARV